jgi:hypothetical protein
VNYKASKSESNKHTKYKTRQFVTDDNKLIIIVRIITTIIIKSGNNLEVRKQTVCIYKDTLSIIMRNVKVIIVFTSIY